MTNDICSVHGIVTECISSQFAKLKVAVALVIIRDKPAGQNVKDFVGSLLLFHNDREQRWKAEYYRLKREVLLLRQQQLLLGFNNSILNRRSQSNDDAGRQDYQHSQMLLTPPDSQQSLSSQPNGRTSCTTLALLPATSNKTDQATDVNRMEFLQAFFYLEHHLRLSRSPGMVGNNLLENDVVRQSVLSVLQHVERNASKENSDFTKCLDSLRICVQLLDRHDKWSRAIRDKLTELSSSWLLRVTQGDNVLKHYALLQILADSNGMAVLLADILVKAIIESQERISQWEWDGMELVPRTVLVHFFSASYYILLLEKTIPRMAPSDKTRFVSVLSHIEQRVHLNFPLFAASMMRLSHQLAN